MLQKQQICRTWVGNPFWRFRAVHHGFQDWSATALVERVHLPMETRSLSWRRSGMASCLLQRVMAATSLTERQRQSSWLRSRLATHWSAFSAMGRGHYLETFWSCSRKISCLQSLTSCSLIAILMVVAKGPTKRVVDLWRRLTKMVDAKASCKLSCWCQKIWVLAQRCFVHFVLKGMCVNLLLLGCKQPLRAFIFILECRACLSGLSF